MSAQHWSGHGKPRAMAGEPILIGRDLRKTYGTTTALDGIDVTIAAAESLAIMGPSGSGKSTLLHVLAGVLRPDQGEVHLRGNRIDSLSENQLSLLRRSAFGFVFQSGQLLPELPAEENVALPLMLAGVPRLEAVRRSRPWFPRLDLDGLEQRRPGQLSGGQAQRVAIARALVATPEVIFADEPTGALDQRSGKEVIELLTAVARDQGAALVVVTHDPGVAAHCARVLHVRDGQIAQPTAAAGR